MMNILIIGLCFMAGVPIAVTVYSGLTLIEAVNFSEKIEESANKVLRRRGKLDQSRLEMSREGILFRLGDYNASPLKWIMLRVTAGLLVSMFIYLFAGSIIYSAVGLFLGFVFVTLLARILNDKDNDAMLMDIYNTYSTIQIQLESGLYIANALEYSYTMAYNKRYKEALAELVLNMSDKTITMAESVEIFRNRFSNPEINKLCGMLTSFALYGVTEEYTQDIMNQITAIIESATLKAEADIESRAGLTNMAFFVCIIAMIAVAIFKSFSGISIF